MTLDPSGLGQLQEGATTQEGFRGQSTYTHSGQMARTPDEMRALIREKAFLIKFETLKLC